MLTNQIRRHLPAASALALSLAAGCANAALPSFDTLDQDADGFITETEASASPALEKVFVAADSDGDGKLSKKEYEVIEG